MPSAHRIKDAISAVLEDNPGGEMVFERASPDGPWQVVEGLGLPGAARRMESSKPESLSGRRRDITSELEKIWGNATDAAFWLNSPHPELQGETPRSQMRTVAGAIRVRNLVAALDEGFPV